MNIEANRLQTFQSWPENAVVPPRQLARNGFFATGNFLETECFSCHKRITNWENDDSIRGRHMQLDPACAFLSNPSSSGNVPFQQDSSDLTPSTTQQERVSAHAANAGSTPTDSIEAELRIEANRLATFVNWPNPNITPQSLAKAGFYYLNRSDEVRCAWCKGVIAQWEREDNAFEEHQRFFPDCPRVKLGPLIEIASEGIRDLGIQQISPPKRPKFSSLDARLRTYTNWPISDIQRPEALAQAGLYYHGIDDQVRCFHCYIGLRLWQKEDDPWFEHAKWYPRCQFVRLVKGPSYVQQVQAMTRQSVPQHTADTYEELPVESNVSIEDAMCSSPVLQALEMGIDVGSLRTVTQRRLELTGRPYDTVENLLRAVFGDSDEDEDDDFGHTLTEESEAGAVASFLRRVATSVIMDNFLHSSPREASTSAAVSDAVSNCVPHGDQGGDVAPTSTRVPVSLASETIKSCTMPPDSVTSMSKMQLAGRTQNVETKKKSTPDRSISLEEENRQLKDARLCKVCLDEEVGVVFLPCGHLVTCVQCASGVNQCPMCRTVIKGFVRTYLS